MVEPVRRRIQILLLLIAAVAAVAECQPVRVSSAVGIARVKYAGGGDWYNDPTAEVNLLKFIAREAGVEVDARYGFVELGDDRLYQHPFLFLTGHGNILFSDEEARRLRVHLENGGFLYADDDYGMDKSFRREMRKVFPGEEFVELPFSHGIYRVLFPFPGGPPKTHEHDNKPPRGLGIFVRGRLVVYYTVESNPSDGWADAEVHNDPEAKRQEALRFGANIFLWAMTR
jgi:hypothetical protein